MKVRAEATCLAPGWAVRVPEVEGAVTQVREETDIAAAAADAVATLLEIDPAGIDVVVRTSQVEAPSGHQEQQIPP